MCPANPYYDSTGYPSTGAAGSSSSMRSELDLVEAGFNKLPTLSGNGGKLVGVNAGATALEAKTHDAVKAALGLEQVDNISDADKPISDLTQAALDDKEDSLGNPSADGMVLASTMAGVRSWVTKNQGPLAIQVFTSSGTYTKTTGAVTAVIEVMGGGGGGAGSSGGTNGTGGSGGGYAKKRISLTGVTTETVTIAAAGTGGVGTTDGAAGGTSSFGSHVSATGGGKGKYMVDSDVGGTGVGGDINIQGGRGSANFGGNSLLGTESAFTLAGGTVTGTGYGVGGTGTGSGTPANGEAGTPGVVIVTEY